MVDRNLHGLCYRGRMQYVIRRLCVAAGRMLHPPYGRGARRLVIFCMFIIGLGRLGLLPFTSVTFFPARVYGGLLLLSGALLMATTFTRRMHWQGRAAAVLAAGVLAGMGADVLPSLTSAAVMWALAYTCIGEASVKHEC
jgi:hypothetical protein